MDELQPNPDDCVKFEPNAFKQEKCKHCARPWTEHKDVISEEYLQKFLQKRQQAQEEKEKKEAEAQQAAAAKKLAKKRASQAVEDDWLFDDKDKKESAALDDNDSEDDFAFKMFLPSEMEKAPPKPVNKELKVVNLIDWGECDVADETEEVTGGEATGSSVSTRAPLIEARPDTSYPGRGPLDFQDAPGMSAYQSGNQDLMTEIQLLRQMLADANEEKTIQVAIVRDEVVEKQEQVQELTRQKSELEALLREARSKLDSTDAKENEPEKDNAEEERLRVRMSELEAQLEAAQAEKNAEAAKAAEAQRAAEAQIAAAAGGAEAASSSQIQEALVTVSEVTELCNRTSRILGEGEGGESSSSSSHLQADLARCRERAQCAADAAERVIFDKRQLATRVEELERLERERKDYAQAVRDVRLYAEQQLQTILQRMSVSHGHQAELPKLGS